ncbi:hypothetical protein SGLAU_23445 [Streptomyces glaucescens]|uniref:Uncharacterized protein n=1 Tax=Streptomyces glaucescens TaxID=1907 RepID=A0A089X9K5_STRGA|nr:hypothetical protein SGLAU_23445 [Streptomyces glaucescens]
MLRELFADADRGAVLERMTAGFDDRVARCRHLPAVVDRQAAPPQAEDLAWVVAALRARAGG